MAHILNDSRSCIASIYTMFVLCFCLCFDEMKLDLLNIKGWNKDNECLQNCHIIKNSHFNSLVLYLESSHGIFMWGALERENDFDFVIE